MAESRDCESAVPGYPRVCGPKGRKLETIVPGQTTSDGATCPAEASRGVRAEACAPAQRRLTPGQAVQLVAEYQDGASMKDLAAKWQLHRTTVAACLRRADVELRRQGVRDGVTDIGASECEVAATVGASLKKESGTMSPSSRSSSWVLSFSRRTIYIKRMGSSLHEHVTVLPSPMKG